MILVLWGCFSLLSRYALFFSLSSPRSVLNFRFSFVFAILLVSPSLLIWDSPVDY